MRVWVIAVLATLVCAAPASAADVDVLKAWTSEDAALSSASKRVTAGLNAWKKAGYRRRGDRVLDALPRHDRLTRRVRARVARAHASTAKGRSARRSALRALDATLEANRALRGMVRAVAGRQRATARRRARALQKANDRIDTHTRRAVRLFRELFPDRTEPAPAPQPAPAPAPQPAPSPQPAPAPSPAPQPPPEEEPGLKIEIPGLPPIVLPILLPLPG